MTPDEAIELLSDQMEVMIDESNILPHPDWIKAVVVLTRALDNRGKHMAYPVRVGRVTNCGSCEQKIRRRVSAHSSISSFCDKCGVGLEWPVW